MWYVITQSVTFWESACGIKHGSVASCWLELQATVLLGSWMSVSFECFMMSGRGFCDGPITHPEESYRVCVCVCLSVIVKPQQGGSQGLQGLSSHGGKEFHEVTVQHPSEDTFVQNTCYKYLNPFKQISADTQICVLKSDYQYIFTRCEYMYQSIWPKHILLSKLDRQYIFTSVYRHHGRHLDDGGLRW